jgi:hypothetical protein
MLLGNIELALNETEAAKKAYATAREVGSPQLNLDPVNYALATRDIAAAQKALGEEQTRSFPYFEAEKALRRASLEASQGRFGAAAKSAGDAEAIAKKAALTAAPERAELASIAASLASGDPAAVAALRAFIAAESARLDGAIASYDFSAYTHLSLAAMLALRNGAPEEGERALRALEPHAARNGYFSIREPYRTAACEAGIARDAKEAVRCLEALIADDAYYPTRVALARAYRAAGDDAKALATEHWLVEHRGRAVAEYLGEFAAQVPNLIAADAAAVDAAELELEAGHADTAGKLISELERAWPDADRDAPVVRRMRALSDRLRAGTSGAQQKQR